MFVKPRDELTLVEIRAISEPLLRKIVNTATGERKKLCKLRGKMLNYSSAQLVNFDVIKDKIVEKSEGGYVTVHTEKKIKPKRKAGGDVVSIIIEPEEKFYIISSFKRRRLQDSILSRTGKIGKD